MSRIVLTTIGSLGDLHPKIAIALELRKRGHDVVFATHKEYQGKYATKAANIGRIIQAESREISYITNIEVITVTAITDIGRDFL